MKDGNTVGPYIRLLACFKKACVSIRRELYTINVFNTFGLSITLIGLIKMILIEACSEVWIGERL